MNKKEFGNFLLVVGGAMMVFPLLVAIFLPINAYGDNTIPAIFGIGAILLVIGFFLVGGLIPKPKKNIEEFASIEKGMCDSTDNPRAVFSSILLALAPKQWFKNCSQLLTLVGKLKNRGD